MSNWVLSIVKERLSNLPVTTYERSLDEEGSHSRRDMARAKISHELHSDSEQENPPLTE